MWLKVKFKKSGKDEWVLTVTHFDFIKLRFYAKHLFLKFIYHELIFAAI